MKKIRFSDEQIIGIPKEQQAGLPVAEICRCHGISDATFYTWRSRYSGMTVWSRDYPVRASSRGERRCSRPPS